jgi:hypothetical protein
MAWGLPKHIAREPDPVKAQLATVPDAHRTDHVWFQSGTRWKCCICGAITLAEQPPDHPTPEDWLPHTYEKLTEFERCLCPLRLK